MDVTGKVVLLTGARRIGADIVEGGDALSWMTMEPWREVLNDLYGSFAKPLQNSRISMVMLRFSMASMVDTGR